MTNLNINEDFIVHLEQKHRASIANQNMEG